MLKHSYPTFLGIGAQKTGTTWLHKMLSLHPDIGMPEQKELHFWDRQLPTVQAIEDYKNIFSNLDGRVRGEITPSYAILPLQKIAAIKEYFPYLRAIYILRDPIKRAWSQARMELSRYIKKNGASPPDLAAWLTAQLNSPESIARSDYVTCLKNWYSYFTKAQVRIFIYEAAFANPRNFLRECAEYLSVDPQFFANLNDPGVTNTIYPEKTILGIERIELPEELQKSCLEPLNRIYGPQIEELSHILKKDFTALWQNGN